MDSPQHNNVKARVAVDTLWKSVMDNVHEHSIEDAIIDGLLRLKQGTPDPFLFVEHCTKYTLYEHQISIMEQLYNKESIVEVRESRVSGVTFTTMLYLVWYALTHRDKNIILGSNALQSTECNISTIYHMINGITIANELSEGIIVSNTKTSILLSNGTHIQARPITEYSLRGMSATIDLLHIDNFDYVRNLDDVLCSCYPVMHRAPFGKIILTTTGVYG